MSNILTAYLNEYKFTINAIKKNSKKGFNFEIYLQAFVFEKDEMFLKMIKTNIFSAYHLF